MYEALRPLLFQLAPSTAHKLGMAALAMPEHLGIVRELMTERMAVRSPKLTVEAMGLRFANPIGIAGGFDKEGKRGRALAALGFGFIELGTVTATAQGENPQPNLFRLPADKALINRLGFPNKGARALAQRVSRARPNVPVGISIGKSRPVSVEDLDAVIADYLISFRAVAPVADFIVVNISSPNTANLRAIQRAEPAERLLGALVAERADRPETARPLPILLKVAPDMDQETFDALLDVVLRTGLDGLVATNTTISREGLLTPADRVAEMGAGGLSGPPLRQRSLAMVARARARLGPSPTLIGVGGISTADDVRAMQDAGANLVQLYTSFIYEGPSLIARLCRELAGLSLRGARPAR